jgi:hypothetical protein
MCVQLARDVNVAIRVETRSKFIPLVAQVRLSREYWQPRIWKLSPAGLCFSIRRWDGIHT